ESGNGLRHLHEGEQPLVHPGATRGVDRQDRDPLLRRALDGTSKLLAPDGAHARAQEAELGDDDRERATIDGRATGNQGFILAGLFPGLFHLFGVGTLPVDELEGVLGPKPGIPLLEGIFVDQETDPLAGAQPEVMPAFRAHATLSLAPAAIEQPGAPGALDPQIFGDLLLAVLAALVTTEQRPELTLALEEISHDRLCLLSFRGA